MGRGDSTPETEFQWNINVYEPGLQSYEMDVFLVVLEG